MRAHVRHGLDDVVRIIGPRAGDAKFERVKSISGRA